MGVFKLAEFQQLMADVQQFAAVLEEVHSKAVDSKEKELLGFAIASIKQGMAEAQTAVPAAAELIEKEARNIVAEGQELQKELEKHKAKLQTMQEAYAKEEAEKEAKRPTLEQLIGPMPAVNGDKLRADLFQALRLQPPTDGVAKPAIKREAGDIWDDWLQSESRP